MATAEVGDAWYGDDPTVNRLQDRAAELTGQEAALYVATGTMANQIGVRLHAGGQGHLVAAADAAHVATTEVMTCAVLAGIAFGPADAIRDGLHDRRRSPSACSNPTTTSTSRSSTLLGVENTVGAYGGTILPSAELRAIRRS